MTEAQTIAYLVAVGFTPEVAAAIVAADRS
jgi:hypothetical protein